MHQKLASRRDASLMPFLWLVAFAMSFVSCRSMGQEKSEPAQANPNEMKTGVTKKEASNQLHEMLTESLRSFLNYNLDYHNKFLKDEPPPRNDICKDGLPDDFPFDGMKNGSFQNVKFFSLLNVNNLYKSFQRELKKGISAYFVEMKLSDKQFIIIVKHNGVKLIKENDFALNERARGIFTYEYSYEKQKWVLVRSEYCRKPAGEQTARAGANAEEGGAPEKAETNQLNEVLIESLRLNLKHDLDFHNKHFKDRPPPKNYVCKEGLPAGFPFDVLPDVTFFSMWDSNKSFQKILKKGIGAYLVYITLTGKQIIVTIDDRGVKLARKNHVETSISDWGVITYDYSCEKQKWLLVNTEYNGI